MLRGPPLFILAIIAFWSVSIAPARAAPGASPAQQTSQQDTDTRPTVVSPSTFLCVSPAGQTTKAQPIPPGKPLEDLCPPGGRLYLSSYTVPPQGLRPIPGARPVESSQQQPPQQPP
jgi:hypothetical protein